MHMGAICGVDVALHMHVVLCTTTVMLSQHAPLCTPQPLPPRHPAYAYQPRLLLRLLCKRYLVNLQRATSETMPWLNTRAMSAKLLMQLDSGEGSQLLHQVRHNLYTRHGTT